MSLYTPIFPHTNPPPARTASSSSATTVNSLPVPLQSYSTSLLQWHLAIAVLPDELCPPSAPSSPTSQARSMRLQTELEQAVREKRYLGDLCRLQCTVRGYATTRPAPEDVDDILEDGEKEPWILPETEEEWFEWEGMMMEKRATSKGKARETQSPTGAKSQSAREKVLDWKARLCPPATGTSNSSSTQVLTPINGRTPLGFPVVKRSSCVLKETKNKPPNSSFSNERLSQAKVANPLQAPDVGPERMPEMNIKAIPADVTAAVVDNTSMSAPGPEIAHEPPPLLDLERSGAASALGLSVNDPPDVTDFSAMFPPSFPTDLQTSTQKPLTTETVSINAHSDAPCPVDSVSASEENARDVVDAVPIPIDRPGPQQPPPLEPAAIHVPKLDPVQLTPPSPPSSSANTPEVPQLPQRCAASDWQNVALGRASNDASIVAQIRAPTTPPAQIRPLTPLSEEGNGRRAPMDLLHTPERTPLRKHRTSPYKLMQHHPGHHVSPQYLINGGASMSSFPITPPRRKAGGCDGQVVTEEVLTTSRRSLTRPRPPSRKSRSRAGTADTEDTEVEIGDGEADPSPAKSERSYFSSPASSDSSSAESFTRAPGSPPRSPLGQFTQDPGRFAPLAESTQPVLPARPRPGAGLGLGALGEPTQPSAAHSSQLTSHGLDVPGSATAGASQRLQRLSSGFGFGAYNSQYDVDAHVNELSNFMEQDVDFSAWLRNMDDDEDESRGKDEGKGGIEVAATASSRESAEKDEDEEAAVEMLAFAASPVTPIGVWA